MSIRESWRRIARWYAAEAPAGNLRLAPGAREAEIAAFEAAVGYALPPDVRESLAIHNGSLRADYQYSDLVGFGELLPLERIYELWEQMRQAQEEGDFAVDGDPVWDVTAAGTLGVAAIRPVFWSVARLPLTDNGGNYLMIDLDPPTNGSAGQYGQVILHDQEIGPVAVVAASWADLLEHIADHLDAGDYFFSDEDGQAMRREE